MRKQTLMRMAAMAAAGMVLMTGCGGNGSPAATTAIIIDRNLIKHIGMVYMGGIPCPGGIQPVLGLIILSLNRLRNPGVVHPF